MGYRIDYEPVNRAFQIRTGRRLRVPLLSAVFFVIFLLLVRFCWVQGTDALRAMFFPGDWQVTGQALEALAENMRAGHTFSHSAAVFCREIIQEAGIGIG